MPSSNDKFPDPWENPSEANQPDSSQGKAQQPNSSDASDEFGLDELKDLIGDSENQPDAMGSDPANLYPDLESSDENFDDLLSSLGIGGAATSSQEPDPASLIADLEAIANQPKNEPQVPSESINLSSDADSLGVPPITDPTSNINLDDINADIQGLTEEAFPTSPIPDVTTDVSDTLSGGFSTPEISAPDLGNLEEPIISANTPTPPAETPASMADILGEEDSELPATAGFSAADNIEINQPDIPDIDTPAIANPNIDSNVSTPDLPNDILPGAAGLGLGAMASNLTDSNESTPAIQSNDSVNAESNITPEATESSPSSTTPSTGTGESAPSTSTTAPGMAIPVVPPSDNNIDQSVAPPDAGSTPSTASPSTSSPASATPATTASSSPNLGSSSPELAGAGAGNSGTGSSPTATASAGSATKSGSTATYKQRLGNRQGLSAFAIILASMGGIVGYGWNQAGVDNPLKAGFKEPGLGVLVDRDDDSEEEEKNSLIPSIVGGASDNTSDGTQAGDRDGSFAQSQGQSATDKLAATSNTGTGSSASADDAEVEEDAAKGNDDNVIGANNADGTNSNDPNQQTPPPIDISDVPPEHWAHPYVVAMHEQGIIPDFPDGKFQPDKPVTRAELAASLQRAFKDSSGGESITFTDIPSGYWATDSITHAVNTGFMSGYSEDTFEPNQQIPRYQVLVSLVSGLNLSKVEDKGKAQDALKDYPDVQEMPDWALGQVAASEKAKLIIKGSDQDKVLAPNRPATRAEVNAMIYQALVNAGKIKDTVKSKS